MCLISSVASHCLKKRHFLFTCRFASEPNLTRYAKIAINLNNKTVRDVALRVRWMNVSYIRVAVTSRLCHYECLNLFFILDRVLINFFVRDDA